MRLNDICAEIVDCEHKTAPEGDGYALSVGTRAMKDGRLVIDACKPVSEVTYIGWSRRMEPVEGDLVLAREAPVGQVVRVPRRPRICLGQRTVLIRPDAALVHPRFLHYWLLGPDAQRPMAEQAAGATVPHLNVEDIRRLEVSKLPPDRRHQRAAAETLGAIDDLIENNRRRVEVLEEIARAIYREWFVHFRYPGHENAVFVDSPLGPIPRDWAVSRLEEVADARRGLSWDRSSEIESGGTPVVTIPNLKSRLTFEGCTRLAEVSATDRTRFSLAPDDILLVGSNGNPDRVGYSVRVPDATSALFASFLMRVRTDTSATSAKLLYHQLSDPSGLIESLKATAVGATGLRNLRITTLREALISVPDSGTRQLFEETCGAIHRSADVLDTQLKRLGRLRDLLLPELVSGKIDVSSLDLDALVEDSVA